MKLGKEDKITARRHALNARIRTSSQCVIGKSVNPSPGDATHRKMQKEREPGLRVQFREKFLLTRCHAPSMLVRVRDAWLSALMVEAAELERTEPSWTSLPAPPRPMW